MPMDVPMDPKSESADNRLIAALPERERRRLLTTARTVQLKPAEVLYETGEAIRHAYFPLTSCIAIGRRIDGHAALDVALIGNEGMFGVNLLLGSETSIQVVVVRGSGQALRIEAASLLSSLRDCPALTRTLLRYVHVRMCDLAQNIACTRFHVVEARLARLLLMTQDRTAKSAMKLTHESLADRLGVRRAGISNAASALQRLHLISYRRGEIRILDRDGLRQAACSCYAADNETYAGFMR